MKRAVFSVFLFMLVLRADFQPPRWRYRRPLPTETGTLNVVNVDRSIYVHSQPELSDLRIVREAGVEVPYVSETMSESHERREVPASIVNQGVTPSGDLELTLDVGERQRHNRIRIATPRTDFRQRVGIATSDDGRVWTRVRDDGYIFDFSKAVRHVAVLDVGYPVSARRFIRVTVYGWNDPKAVSQCFVTFEESTPAVRDVMASLNADPRENPKTQSTLYTWDLGVPGIPHDELSLEVDTAAFMRAAAVESSDDGKRWNPLGQGVLSRFSRQQPSALVFPRDHERYFRLRIFNGDDQPLAIKSVTLSAVRTRVKFRPDATGAYWLYYGNPDARTPSYDLREVLAREAPIPETTISMGPEESNGEYREKPAPLKPWSDRHPAILYVTLAIAVLALGTVTVRFLKKVSAENR